MSCTPQATSDTFCTLLDAGVCLAAPDPGLSGLARWRALARAALAGLDPGDAALVIASTNGGGDALDAARWRAAFGPGLLAGTPWEQTRTPVVSGSCVSALQALDTAQALVVQGTRVLLLAVDVLSATSQANFEALRVLAEDPRPYQPANAGFRCGEAAVALLLAGDGDGLRLGRPALSQDVDDHDGLAHTLLGARLERARVFVGQGTGPEAADRAELAALATAPPTTPLTTPALAHGHTLAASGALVLAQLARGALPTLPWPRALDGRPLLAYPTAADDAVVFGRALGGSCAALGVGAAAGPPPPPRYVAPAALPPLFHPGLRALVADAPTRRPARPPDRLLVLLDAPLAPPPRALVGGRVLPSAVLELTPATVPRLVAQAWGYTGPAVAWVGGDPAPWLAAHRARGERLAVLQIDDVHDGFRVTWAIDEVRT